MIKISDRCILLGFVIMLCITISFFSSIIMVNNYNFKSYLPHQGDNNMEQNFHLIRKKNYTNVIVLLWTQTYIEPWIKKYTCENLTCEVTADRKKLKSSHVIVISASFMPKLTSLPPKQSGQSWLLMTRESPAIDSFNKLLNGQINLISTYHHTADVSWAYGRTVAIGSQMDFTIRKTEYPNKTYPMYRGYSYVINTTFENLIGNKSKQVLWFISNCGSKASCRMHYMTVLFCRLSVNVFHPRTIHLPR